MSPARPDLYWTDKGQGPTLLCLHGIGSSSASLRRQVDALSEEFRVVAWDAPGYGRSGEAREAGSLDYYATEAAGLIRSLDGAAHVLGVSWGGVISAQLALTHPDLVKSLVLVSASRGSGRDPASAAAMACRAENMMRDGVATYARARAPKLLSPTAPEHLIDEVVSIMTSDVRHCGYTSAARAMASADLSGRLSEINVPTLVICGTHDTVTGPAESTKIANSIPGARYAPIEGAGHLVNQEFPDAVNAAVLGFLRNTDSHNA
jgi:3-oxoadipate enol-lactonase